MLRHFCTSQLHQAGMRLFAIQELLGHAWSGATGRYIPIHASHVEDAWVAGPNAPPPMEGTGLMQWNLRLAAAAGGGWPRRHARPRTGRSPTTPVSQSSIAEGQAMLLEGVAVRRPLVCTSAMSTLSESLMAAAVGLPPVRAAGVIGSTEPAISNLC